MKMIGSDQIRSDQRTFICQLFNDCVAKLISRNGEQNIIQHHMIHVKHERRSFYEQQMRHKNLLFITLRYVK